MRSQLLIPILEYEDEYLGLSGVGVEIAVADPDVLILSTDINTQGNFLTAINRQADLSLSVNRQGDFSITINRVADLLSSINRCVSTM